MEVRIEESWRKVLQPEFDKPYFELLTSFVRKEYQSKQVFPPAPLIFNAFDSCPFEQVKVDYRSGSVSRAGAGDGALV